MSDLISTEQLAARPSRAQIFERLDFPVELFFSAYGVRALDASILTRLFACLPPNWKRARDARVERLYSISVERDLYLLHADEIELARTANIENLLEIFESNLQLYIAEMSPQKVFIHAGVVGWRGAAIMIPGRSMSGKTTLVREFVRAGAIYYSDEYAVLDANGRVHPFPKPLAIRDETFRQRKHAVEAFGGRAGTKPLPVGLVIITEHKAGKRNWRPNRLSQGFAALEILNHAVAARRQPERVMAALQRVVKRAMVVKGARGEAKQMVETVLSGCGV